jgi:hypothetical protein
MKPKVNLQASVLVSAAASLALSISLFGMASLKEFQERTK